MVQTAFFERHQQGGRLGNDNTHRISLFSIRTFVHKPPRRLRFWLPAIFYIAAQ